MFRNIRHFTKAAITSYIFVKLSFTLIPSAIAAITVSVIKKRKKGKVKAPESPIVKFWLDSLNHGEMDEVEDIIAPDFVWYANDIEVQLSKPEDDVYQLFRENVAFIRTLMPDVQVALKEEVIGEDKIAVRCDVIGTHTGNVPGIPVSGNAVAWEEVAFFYTAAGKLAELKTMFDSEHWLVQIGVVSSP